MTNSENTHSHLDGDTLSQLQDFMRRAQRAQAAVNEQGAGRPETRNEYAARHREEAAETKPDRLGALAADIQGITPRAARTDYEEINLIFENKKDDSENTL